MNGVYVSPYAAYFSSKLDPRIHDLIMKHFFYEACLCILQKTKWKLHSVRNREQISVI